MNSVIFKDAREAGFLPFSDPRARHITDVLRLTSGSEIFAGILNEKLYKTKIEIEDGGVRFLKCETPLENPGLLNATICAAFSRPQIAKRVMFEAALFGVKRLVFYAAEKGDSSYLKSSLYSEGEILAQFIKGAEQACSSFVPEFCAAKNLEEALGIAEPLPIKIAPDPYEASGSFADFLPQNLDEPLCVVFGGERGFNNFERDMLRENGFALASLGKRILRTDSAIISVLGILNLKYSK